MKQWHQKDTLTHSILIPQWNIFAGPSATWPCKPYGRCLRKKKFIWEQILKPPGKDPQSTATTLSTHVCYGIGMTVPHVHSRYDQPELIPLTRPAKEGLTPNFSIGRHARKQHKGNRASPAKSGAGKHPTKSPYALHGRRGKRKQKGVNACCHEVLHSSQDLPAFWNHP